MESCLLMLTHLEEDGCNFWAQKHSSGIKANLDLITNSLQSCKSVAGSLKTESYLKSKTFASQFMDETWYRCRVVCTISKNKCLVLYIDFGNCEEKSPDSLAEVPRNMQESSLAALAQRYRFHNIAINQGSSEDVLSFLEATCFNVVLEAEIMEKTEDPKSASQVKVYDREGVRIGARLIDLGYAIEQNDTMLKAKVVISSPPVPPAQLFRNPLCSSVEDLSDQNSFTELNKSSSGHQVLSACDRRNKRTDNVNSTVTTLRHDLEVMHKENAELKKCVRHWKSLYLDLQQGLVRSESGGSVVNGMDCSTPCKVDTSKTNGARMSSNRSMDADEEVSRSQNNSLEQQMSENFQTPIKAICNQVEALEVTIACTPADRVIDRTALAPLMMQTIVPTLNCYKTLSNLTGIVEDCLKYERKMSEVVTLIKSHIDADGNCNAVIKLGLITKRNTLMDNLKSSLEQAVKILSNPNEQISSDVSKFVKTLGDLSLEYGKDVVKEGNVTELSVADLELEKTNLKTRADLVGLLDKMRFGVSRKFEAFLKFKDYRTQFQATIDDVSHFEGQERIINNLVKLNRGIRKQKQAIRLLVTEIKNTTEEKQDAPPGEHDDLNVSIESAQGKLSKLRFDIQNSFETKWEQMEIIANTVEKFCPEWLIECPDLGLDDYIKGEGMIMNGMEMDHFDVNEGEVEEYMNAAVYSTEYRGEKIALHKYSVCGPQRIAKALKKISYYRNAVCPTMTMPMGVFTDSDATFVMVSTPSVPTTFITEAGPLSIEVREQILKDIASALLSLHENGATHGMVSKSCVLVSDMGRGILSVPNFICNANEQSLSNDIVQFGQLAASLTQDSRDDAKLQKIVITCLERSTEVTMKNALALF